MRILLDAYAWVEYLKGSKNGRVAKRFLEDKESEIYTSILSIAELSDAFHRGEMSAHLDWAEIQTFIELNSTLVALDAGEMADAGAIKALMRKRYKDFGLIDAIILATSRKLHAKILMGDKHLVGEGNALPLA